MLGLFYFLGLVACISARKIGENQIGWTLGDLVSPSSPMLTPENIIVPNGSKNIKRQNVIGAIINRVDFTYVEVLCIVWTKEVKNLDIVGVIIIGFGDEFYFVGQSEGHYNVQSRRSADIPDFWNQHRPRRIVCEIGCDANVINRKPWSILDQAFCSHFRQLPLGSSRLSQVGGTLHNQDGNANYRSERSNYSENKIYLFSACLSFVFFTALAIFGLWNLYWKINKSFTAYLVVWLIGMVGAMASVSIGLIAAASL